MEAPGPTPEPQAQNDPLTRVAIFLVATVRPSDGALRAVPSLAAGLPKLVRAVGTRDPSARLTCVLAVGADCWERIIGSPAIR